MAGTQFWTGQKTGVVVVITDADNVTEVSIAVVTAPVLVSGAFKFQGQDSGTITLGTIGQTLTVSGTGGTSPIGYLKIDASGGAVDIIMKT